MTGEPRCSPLCGATKAYGRFDQPWKHEPECPVRLAWEAEKKTVAGIPIRTSEDVPRGAVEIHDEDGTFQARMWI